MKLSKEQIEKIILGIVGCIIVTIVLVTFVLGPNLRKIIQLSGKIREKKNELIRAERDVSSLARIRADVNRLNEEVKGYQVNMPESAPDWLLGRLNRLADESGISFDKIEPKGEITQVGLFLLQGLYIEFRSDYHTLGRFINRLENLSPFISILDISITGNKDDVKRHIIKLMVGAYVYEK